MLRRRADTGLRRWAALVPAESKQRAAFGCRKGIRSKACAHFAQRLPNPLPTLCPGMPSIAKSLCPKVPREGKECAFKASPAMHQKGDYL